MWKKIVVMGIALIGTFSVVYAMNNEMFANATSSIYNAGGNVTGRIGSTIKGDKYSLQGGGLEWIALSKGTSNDLWFSMSTGNYMTSSAFTYSPTGSNITDANYTGNYVVDSKDNTSTYGLYENSLLKLSMNNLNSSFTDKDKLVIGQRDKLGLNNCKESVSSNWKNSCSKLLETESFGNIAFVASSPELAVNLSGGNALTVSTNNSKDVADKEESGYFWTSNLLSTPTSIYSGLVYSNKTGVHTSDLDNVVSGANTYPNQVAKKGYASAKAIAGVRPSIYLDMEDIVFAVSQGTSSEVGNVKSPVLPDLYSNIVLAMSNYDAMKLRVEDVDQPIQASMTGLVNSSGTSITKMQENGLVYINAKAENRDSVVSVILTKYNDITKKDEFVYYKPLQKAQGLNKDYTYIFDTAGIAVGEYKIAIVNEQYDDTTKDPAYSSKITDFKPLEIVVPLNTLTHTASSGSSVTAYYVSTNKGNVKTSNKVASISTKDGVGNSTVDGVFENGIIYKVQPATDTTHKDDYNSFTIPTESGKDKPMMDTNNSKPYVIAKPSSGDFLVPGVYKYRVQAYDANGSPTAYEASDTTKSNPFAQLNDGTIVKGITPSQGLITEDITTVVYPHNSQVTYAQLKDANGAYYSKDDINKSDFASHLGTLTFATDANMQTLYDEGYSINTTSSKIMKKGSTTEQISALKITSDASDKSKFYIDKNSAVTSGTYEFDAWLYFKNDKGDTALLKVTEQSLYIAPSLAYGNPDKVSEGLATDTYERKYNAYASSDNHENIFTLISTDKTDFTSNSAVKYCVYDEVEKKCATSNDNDVLKLTDKGNGTASITAKTYQKDDSDILVRSYLEDSKGTILTYKDITIKINRSERKMKWEGKAISSLSSTVTLKEDNNYELSLPYDSANPVEYTYSKIAKDAVAPANGILALREDEGTGTFSSTMSGNLASGTAENSFKLTDKCTGTACYIEVAKTQDDIYEAGTIKLYIVTEDMQAIADDKISWKYNDAGSWKVAANPLLLNYKEDGVVPTAIDTAKLPTDIKNVKIVYTLEDTKKVDTITVANKSGSETEGEVSILQANQGTDNASIKAVITSDNYAKKTVTLPVKINKLRQTISFNETFAALPDNVKVSASANYDYGATLQVDKDTAGKGTVSYTVAGNPVDMLTNNSENKTLNVTKAGSVTITATLTDDKNHTSTTKSVSKTITYYADAGLTWTQDTTKPEAVNTINGGTTGDADVNKQVGDIAIDGGKSSAYTFTIDNTKHSDDSTYFSVVLNSDKKSGKVKIIKKIDAAALQAHAAQVSVGDTYEWTIHVKAVGTTDSTDKAEADIKITFTGAQPDITFTNATNKIITDTYEIDKNIEFGVQRGSIAASNPTITISGYTSALTLNENGVSALIKSANTDNSDKVRSGRTIQVKGEVTASAGYKTGSSPQNDVVIKKADHPVIDFETKIFSSSNNVDAFISGILHGNGKFNEDVTITPIKADVADAWIIEPYTVSKGEAYEDPSMAISPKGYLGTLDFTITATGDDNYKPLSDDTKTTVEFSEEGGIVYKPINVNYGDKTKNVLDFIVSPSPKDDPDTVTYAYSGYDDTLISIDADGKVTPLKVGTSTLTFKRMDSADNSEMEQNIKVTIKPKDITIYVNDLHKKVGEVVTNDMYSIDTSKSTAFETGDDVGTLTYSCQDNNVEVTSLANGLQGPVPKVLPINVTYVGGDASKKANYAITYMPGNLNITQDEAQESWISVLPKGTATLQNNWYNGDVEVKLNAISGSYSEISPDGNTPWENSFTISEEGKITQNISFRDPTSLARATSITKELLIDKNAPRVESIKAKSSNNKLEDIMNSLTFGVFFKPGTEFAITTIDKSTGSGVNQVSGTSSLTYSIYKIEKDNSETVLEKDKTITIKDETAKIKISDNSGTYKVCTKATDLAGNKGTTENCATVKIGYDNTNISTGENNCPDINLDFNDDGITELNIDIDGDKIPDLNIDSDFDGESDINVDSDEDQKPDLNLVELSEWNPGICSTIDNKTYATMEDIKPEVNVVVDNETDEIKDQGPYLNIDTDGDMKADFNISFDGVNPYLNIGKVPEQWLPESDHDVNDFAYDTMDDLEPILNMGIIDEKYPSINVDTDQDGKADLNIDTTGDGIPDVNVDGDGDGKEDINIDIDNNGTPDEKVMKIETWQPDTLVKGVVPYKTMKLSYTEKGNDSLTDNDVVIEKPNGSFLPNHSLKVNDVTTDKKDKIKNNLPNNLKDKNIEAVYDVQYFVENVKAQPGESIKVKLPAKAGLRNPVLLVEMADGSYKSITPKEEDGYYVYETDFLGMVSILGDVEEDKPDVVLPSPDENVGGSNQPNTSVKGTYTTGTNTGDATNIILYGIVFTSAIIFILVGISKTSKHNT